MKKPVIVGPHDYQRYRLDRILMRGIGPNGHSKRYGFYTMRGEIHRLLRVLTGHPYPADQCNGPRVVAYHVSGDGMTLFEATLKDQKLRLGCTLFSKEDTKQIAAWAGRKL